MADAQDDGQEAHRRRDETEPRSIEEAKGRTPDLSSGEITRKKEDEDAHDQDKSQIQRPIAIGSIPSTDINKEKMKGDEKGMAVSSKKDCKYFLAGKCSFGIRCRYKHSQELPDMNRVPICERFQKGACTFGSVCIFQHKEREPYCVQRPESESSRPNKRPKPIPDSGELEFGFERERRGTRENLQEQRSEAQDNQQENHNVDAHVQHNLENQNVDTQEENLQEMPQNQNVVDTHHDQQNLEEQRQSDIQRQRTESRLRLAQMQPTVEFNDQSRLRKTLDELGIPRKRNDGF